jgi:hypothetical protein
MNLASSVESQTATSAMSAGSPRRFMAAWAARAESENSGSNSVNGVLITPGLTLLMRMASAPVSTPEIDSISTPDRIHGLSTVSLLRTQALRLPLHLRRRPRLGGVVKDE